MQRTEKEALIKESNQFKAPKVTIIVYVVK